MKRHVMLFETYLGKEGIANAARRRDPELVRYLLDRGGDPNGEDNFGYTPLYIAVSQMSPDIVKVLLDRGADPFMKVYGGESPYDLAVYMSQDEKTSERDMEKIQMILNMFDKA